jgi:hypothetical protein
VRCKSFRAFVVNTDFSLVNIFANHNGFVIKIGKTEPAKE